MLCQTFGMEFAVVGYAGDANGVLMACQTFGMGLAVNDFYEVLINFWARRRRKFKKYGEGN
jgi:hypothetical protein